MGNTLLHVQMMEIVDIWAVVFRFVGDRAPFLEMVDTLKFEQCRWDPDAFTGRGGWIVDIATLILYADRFDNVQQRLKLAQERHMRQLSAIIDKELEESERKR